MDNDDNKATNKNSFEDISNKVEFVYTFRDKYFETHSIEEAIKKSEELDLLLAKTLTFLEENESEALKYNKAKFFYLKGKLLNVSSTYSKEAENLLSKALKLDRKLVETWNELGECYWKNGEIQKAQGCFETALKEKKNKIALRSLSMLARQATAANREEQINNIKKGLQYAKDAVQLDPQDGLSWSVLGNAHLSCFFGIQQNPHILMQSLRSYAQAEKDIIAKSTPDLYYNKGTALCYKEDFKAALDCFNQARLYDPTWEPPGEKEEQLIKYLNEIVELVSTNGKLKTKRLQQLLNSLNSSQLGPYINKNDISQISINELSSGCNTGKVILGKVVCSVRNENSVPFTFCMTDDINSCVVVTVFNLAAGKGVIIGDSVAIPEPDLNLVNFEYKNVTYKFNLIRVETPIKLAVNGKLLQRSQVADVQLSVFNKSD